MDRTQSLVITFLIVIILLLLFSKITVQYHTPQPQESQQPVVANQKENNTPKVNHPTEITASQPTEFNPNPLANLEEDEYMPEELKKQIRELEDRFYYDDCGKN